MRQWPDIEPELMPTGTGDLYYHKECYMRFCDKSKVARAETRTCKIEEKSYATEKGKQSDQANVNEQGEHLQPMRSSARIASILSSTASVEGRTAHVMPELCIICKRKDAYITDKVMLLFYYSTDHPRQFLMTLEVVDFVFNAGNKKKKDRQAGQSRDV